MPVIFLWSGLWGMDARKTPEALLQVRVDLTKRVEYHQPPDIWKMVLFQSDWSTINLLKTGKWCYPKARGVSPTS